MQNFGADITELRGLDLNQRPSGYEPCGFHAGRFQYVLIRLISYVGSNRNSTDNPVPSGYVLTDLRDKLRDKAIRFEWVPSREMGRRQLVRPVEAMVIYILLVIAAFADQEDLDPFVVSMLAWAWESRMVAPVALDKLT